MTTSSFAKREQLQNKLIHYETQLAELTQERDIAVEELQSTKHELENYHPTIIASNDAETESDDEINEITLALTHILSDLEQTIPLLEDQLCDVGEKVIDLTEQLAKLDGQESYHD